MSLGGGRYRAGRLPPSPAPPARPATGDVPWLPGLGGDRPEPPRPRWYRRPDALGTAATTSALAAWLAAGLRYAPELVFLPLLAASGADHLVYGLTALLILLGTALLVLAAVVFGAIAAAAALPLAVVWLRTPDRPAVAGVALLHMVVAWAVLVLVLPWEALARW